MVWDNFEIFFLFLNVKIYWDLSLKVSWQDSSNDGLEFTFYWRNNKNYS